MIRHGAGGEGLFVRTDDIRELRIDVSDKEKKTGWEIISEYLLTRNLEPWLLQVLLFIYSKTPLQRIFTGIPLGVKEREEYTVVRQEELETLLKEIASEESLADEEEITSTRCRWCGAEDRTDPCIHCAHSQRMDPVTCGFGVRPFEPRYRNRKETEDAEG